MKIFNTLSGKTEEFNTMKDGVINMYVCGPTVYSYAHVGNMCPVIIFDMVYRYFKYRGYDVKYASNFTDVDDKIIKAAKEAGVTEKELTEKYIKIYLDDVKALNCLDIDYRPKVTETMDEIIDYIQLLMDKGYAYQNGDDVYFRVGKVEDYGKLSKQIVEELNAGNRIEVDENKENPYDFVLWKKTKEGITWDSPWGAGRPGWHTECVVMINKLFGDKIDIHGGGVDLKFPHHENEIAQQVALHGNKIANYWMHNGFINIDNVKMSKSLGNVKQAKEMISHYGGNIVRFILVNSYYRTPVNFSDELALAAKKELDKIEQAFNKMSIQLQLNNCSVLEFDGTLDTENFLNALCDDLNTPNALTEVYRIVKEANIALRSNHLDVEVLKVKFFTLKKMLEILGLQFDVHILTSEEIELLNNYNLARKEKDFVKADEYRKVLIEKKLL